VHDSLLLILAWRMMQAQNAPEKGVFFCLLTDIGKNQIDIFTARNGRDPNNVGRKRRGTRGRCLGSQLTGLASDPCICPA
jgi:hypothetical protein